MVGSEFLLKLAEDEFLLDTDWASPYSTNWEQFDYIYQTYYYGPLGENVAPDADMWFLLLAAEAEKDVESRKAR